MASYLTPSVDHNLYTPIMPQTNVAEIFQLISTKQQIYNSNLARINNQRSFISDLDDNLSSQFVKDKVNNFNKKVDEKLKGYTNLDFSINDNVNLVNNMYDPILKDQDFLIDYSTTSHLNNEVQKGLSFRDSANKEKREQYSDTNLQVITDELERLRTAKDSKDLKKIAATASNVHYSPYFDVAGHLNKTLKDSNLQLEYDDASNGYIVTKKGVDADPTWRLHIEKFLELTLPEQGINQLKINARAQVNNLTKMKGRDQVAMEYLQTFPEATKKVDDELDRQQSEIDTKIGLLPPLEKRNYEHKAIYQDLMNKKSHLDNLKKSNIEKKEAYAKLQKQLDDGTYSSDDILEIMMQDMAEANKSGLIEGLAETYAISKSGVKIEPSSFNNYNNLKYNYAKMNQDNIHHAQDLTFKYQELANNKNKTRIEALKEGYDIDEDGNLRAKTGSDYKTQEDVLVAPNSIEELNSQLAQSRQAMLADNDSDIIKFTNKFKEIYHKDPKPGDIASFKHGMLNKYSPELMELYHNSSFYQPTLDAKGDYLTSEVQKAITEFNKMKGREVIKFDKTTGQVVVPDENNNVIQKAGLSLLRGYAKGLASLALANTVGLPNVDLLTVANTAIDKRLTPPDSKKEFEEFLKRKKGKDGYGLGMDVLVESIDIPSGKVGAREYKTFHPETMRTISNLEKTGDNLYGQLTTLNPELKSYKEDNVLKAFEKMKILLNTEDAAPGVKYNLERNGTKLSFSDVDVKKVYNTDLIKNLTPDDKQVIEILQKGMSLPIPHNKYATVDYTKARVSKGETVNYKDKLSIYKEDNTYRIYPNNSFYHYSYDVDKGIKIRQEKNGAYKIEPSKEVLTITDEQAANVPSFDRLIADTYRDIQIQKNIYETDAFKNELNIVIQKYLQANKNLTKNADGTFTIPYTVLNSIKLK